MKRISLIDIVIINYNSTAYLINCLKSINNTSRKLNFKVFIQDNASSDCPEKIKDEFPNINFERNEINSGFSKAVNKAIVKGRSEYILLLNPDTLIEKGFFANCLEYMNNNPDVGILGPRILDGDGRLQNSARAFPRPLTAFFGRSSYLSKRFPKNPITFRNLLSLQSDGKSPMEVDWVSGACMLVRRKAIDDVGLLDERFFMYWEDADWCRRMKEGGWKVVYFPMASVYHFIGGSSEKNVPRSVAAFHISVYRLFDKYLDHSLSYLKPFVFGGLTMRLMLVLFTQLLHRKVIKFKHCLVLRQSQHEGVLPHKIKILRIISRLNIGGPAIHVNLLTRGLDENRFESKLVTGSISPKEGDMMYLFNGNGRRPVVIPYLQREIRFKKDLKAFKKIYSLLTEERPDIVDTHTAKAGFIARFAVVLYNLFHRKNICMIHTFHGHIFDGYFSKANSLLFMNIERFLARITDVIIALSKTQKNELALHYKIAPLYKIKTIELGFDLRPFFSAKTLRGKFRKEYGLSEDAILVCMIGRLVPIKNHFMYFEAARIFLEQNPDANVNFIVVGDGELRDELHEKCRQMGLEQYVKFCGWIKDVPYVYADLDILALTSINEGTPVSLIESMAASVPVIATDAGGVLDLMGPVRKRPEGRGFYICERGLMCRKNDPEEFAQGLKYLIEEDEDEKRSRVVEARAFVEAKFTRNRLYGDMAALYTDLVRSRRCNRALEHQIA